MKHHADTGTQKIEVLLWPQDIHAVEKHFSLGPLIGIEIVHPVQAPAEASIFRSRTAQ